MAGVFGLLQLVAFSEYIRTQLPSKQFQLLLRTAVLIIFVVALGLLVLLTLSGTIAPWTGRFYSLWDTGYAKIHIPIIASVSEHQPTAWPAFFFDLSMLIWVFPAGVYMSFRQLRDEQVFIVIYAVLASYFAGVMVRLMLTLTPIVCVASAMALSQILDTYLVVASPDEATVADTQKSNGSANGSADLAAKLKAVIPDSLRSTKAPLVGVYSTLSKTVVAGSVTAYLLLFVLHCTWVTSNAYSSPSVVLASRMPDGSQHIIDDYREAYYWLRQNTPANAKVMSWWDYGYQIGGMADRPTLVDNNTWNNTHIATVGKAMSSREEVSWPIMRQHEVDYVLVVFGGLLGYSGDDINKFLWMVRIAEGRSSSKASQHNTDSIIQESGRMRSTSGASSPKEASIASTMKPHQPCATRSCTKCHTTTSTRYFQQDRLRIEFVEANYQLKGRSSVYSTRPLLPRTGSSESTKSSSLTISAAHLQRQHPLRRVISERKLASVGVLGRLG